MEEVLTTANERSGSRDPWRSEIPGSLRTCLLQLDAQLVAVVNAEKHLVDPAAICGEVAREHERLMQQMGLGERDGMVEQPGAAPQFESVKPGFTREVGSIRRRVSGR